MQQNAQECIKMRYVRNYTDLRKKLHLSPRSTREESGIAIEPGSQELDSSEGEGVGDGSAGPVRRYGLPARAEHDQEASLASFAGLAAAAASGLGQRHDGKTGEETSASESRMQAAYDEESVKSAIFALQRVMLSEAANADKLAAFIKREVDHNAKLAPVLASAFHRRPQGAFAMMPRAI